MAITITSNKISPTFDSYPVCMCIYFDCILEDYVRLQAFKLFEKSDCSLLYYPGLLTAFILFVYLFGCASGLSCFLGTGGEINDIKNKISNNGKKHQYQLVDKLKFGTPEFLSAQIFLHHYLRIVFCKRTTVQLAPNVRTFWVCSDFN